MGRERGKCRVQLTETEGMSHHEHGTFNLIVFGLSYSIRLLLPLRLRVYVSVAFTRTHTIAGLCDNRLNRSTYSRPETLLV